MTTRYDRKERVSRLRLDPNCHPDIPGEELDLTSYSH